MEDDQRNRLLQFSQKQMQEVAQVCNKIPNYKIEAIVQDNQTEANVGEEINLSIKIEGDEDEEEEEENKNKLVYAPFYPKEKEEQWWLIIADESTKKLLSIKRIDAKSGMEVQISFTPNESGNKTYTAMLV